MKSVTSSAPIGIYDSGVGGLAILGTLAKALPAERFVYVADAGHAPYGEKNSAFIEQRALDIAEFMRAQQVKALVVACNTVSVIAVTSLRRMLTVPVVAMEPAIKPAVARSKSRIVLVLGTTATINSDSVAELCERFGQGSRILLQACPGLVELVEQGLADADETCRLLERYLSPALLEGTDTIVIGCTHYTFLMDAIKRIVGPHISIIEPSEAIAAQLSRVLVSGPGLSDSKQPASPVYFTTGLVSDFQSFLVTTMGSHHEVHGLVSHSQPCQFG